MQSAADRQAINHYLAKHGLGQLGDPGLVAQLGFLIDDDAEFSRLLNVCEPEERRAMYEALVPNLRFKARPFDEYLAEWREQAETRQLPVLNADGTLRAYNVGEIQTEESEVRSQESETSAEDILPSVSHLLSCAVARYHLILTCRRCTREATFPGVNKYEAVRAAREAGWIYAHGEGSTGWEICPDCGQSI